MSTFVRRGAGGGLTVRRGESAATITTPTPLAARNTQRLTRMDAYGHSYGAASTLYGATSLDRVWNRLVADQSHAELWNFHNAGQRLLNVGANSNQAGFGRIMGHDPGNTAAYGAQNYLGRRGVATIMHGINDLEQYGSDADIDQFLACYGLILQACISWVSLASFHLHSTASTGQTFGGSGSWSSGAWLAGFEEGPGATRNANSSSGATYTVAVPANAAGNTVSLFLGANETGGNTAASIITSTLDGDATTPIGWDSLDLTAVLPAAVAHGATVAARYAIPDDASTHSIVITSGTGGLTVSGWGVEATDPRPVVVANCARRSNAYTGEATDAKVALLNTRMGEIVAGFDGAVLAGIDGVLNAESRNFVDGLHPNNRGHDLVARTMRAALDGISLGAQAKGML